MYRLMMRHQGVGSLVLGAIPAGIVVQGAVG